jgi:hypothetical protein
MNRFLHWQVSLLLSIVMVVYGAAPGLVEDYLVADKLKVKASAQSAITVQFPGKPHVRQAESSRQNQPHSLLTDTQSNLQLLECRHFGTSDDLLSECGTAGESGSVRAPPCPLLFLL